MDLEKALEKAWQAAGDVVKAREATNDADIMAPEWLDVAIKDMINAIVRAGNCRSGGNNPPCPPNCP